MDAGWYARCFDGTTNRGMDGKEPNEGMDGRADVLKFEILKFDL